MRSATAPENAVDVGECTGETASPESWLGNSLHSAVDERAQKPHPQLLGEQPSTAELLRRPRADRCGEASGPQRACFLSPMADLFGAGA